MDEVLRRDQNFVTVLGGVTDDSDEDITMLRVDPISKRLLVKASGITAGVTSLNGLTGAITLAAGSNITLTPSGNTITIASTSSGSVTSVSGTANRITSTGGSTPIIDISAAYVGQNSITTLGTITTGVWNGTKIGLAYGGTNADLSATGGTSQVLRQSSSGAAVTVSQLSASDLSNGVTGSGAVALASAPTLSNPVVGTQSTTDNSTKAASTAYVTTAINNAIAGVNPAVAVQAATTSVANTSGFTYNNGVTGIGATLTGSVNTALVVDGYTFNALGQRLLVKNDTQSPSGAFNGVYYVTQVQTALLPPILTRALDYDQPSDINNTGAIPVVNGTVNANTSWLLTSQVTTVGTDPLTYVQFSINPSTIVTTSSILTTSTIYVDVNRTDSYTTNGSVTYPYKTLGAAITAINLLAYGLYTINMAAGAYAEAGNVTFPNSPLIIYGNGSTLTANSGTGNVTLQNAFSVYDLIIVGNFVQSNTSLTVSCQAFDLTLYGNATISGLLTVVSSLWYGNGAANGLVTINSTAVSYFHLSNIGAQVANYYSRIVNSGQLFIFSSQVFANDNANYAITSTAGTSTFSSSSFLYLNAGTGGGLNVSNGATTNPNEITNGEIFVNGATNALTCGTAVTLLDVLKTVNTNTGLSVMPTGSAIGASLYGPISLIGATSGSSQLQAPAVAGTAVLTLPGVTGTLALLASPAFTGTPTAPTAAVGTNTTQLATTAFVTANSLNLGKIVALINNFNFI